MKKCERCGKEYFRQKSEIIVFPNVCKECDRELSNIDGIGGKR